MNGWEKVDVVDALVACCVSLGVGMLRLLMLIRDKQQVRWVELVLEPSFAVFGGLAIWALTEFSSTPDLVQAVLTSLGAWGGPRTIAYLERKYLPENKDA